MVSISINDTNSIGQETRLAKEKKKLLKFDLVISIKKKN